MDRELIDLQFYGFCGIYRESFKLIFSSFKNIFAQLTLCLVLPLTLIILSQIKISDLLFGRLLDDEYSFHDPTFTSAEHHFIRQRLTSEWAVFWSFKAAYLTFVLIFSLLSTAAVVYTIACIYTGKTITFKRVMGVVPKVWKRLLVTFFWNFVVNVVYNIAMALVVFIWAISLGNKNYGFIILIVLLILYLIGFIYINVVWQLASVVSVLEEETYGLKAMKKSRILVKGKLWAASWIFFIMHAFLTGVVFVFWIFVARDWEFLGVGNATMLAIGCLVLAMFVIMLDLVLQTVIYFVCKSVHHEIIDKSSLAEHLEGYGEYERLRRGGEVPLQEQEPAAGV